MAANTKSVADSIPDVPDVTHQPMLLRFPKRSLTDLRYPSSRLKRSKIPGGAGRAIVHIHCKAYMTESNITNKSFSLPDCLDLYPLQLNA